VYTKIKSGLKKIPILNTFGLKIFRAIKYPLTELNYTYSAQFNRKKGINIGGRNPDLVVSLTTIPSRVSRVHLAIESLLRQSLKPDQLILWLSETDSKSAKEDLDTINPNFINQIDRGLVIKFVRDIGPYTSTINALRNFPNSIIITADDDVYYARRWLQDLYNSYQKSPEYIHCHLARMMKKKTEYEIELYSKWSRGYDYFEGPSYNIFPFTVGGCLFPPGSLSDEVLNEDIFLNLCPSQDDLWFKAMALLKGTNCKKVKPFSMGFPQIRGTQKETLYQHNVLEGGNDKAIKAVFDHYDLYRSLKFYT